MAGAVTASECTPVADPTYQCGSQEFQACEIPVGNQVRRYCQHIPAQGGGLPVILSFHGAGGRAANLVSLWRSYTEQSMIIVVPEARETRFQGECSVRWRQIGGAMAGWSSLDHPDDCAGGTGRDDLDFTTKLLDHFDASGRADRFYALGFSNGAGFVFQNYITEGIAARFSGFAAAGNGMDEAKQRAVEGPRGTYGPNTDQRRPFLFQMGTGDKRNFAIEEVVNAIEEGGKCAAKASIREAFECFIASPIDGSKGPYDMPTTRSLTRDWLVAFNNASGSRHEGIYPNLGQGAAPRDITITVREDYYEKPSGDTAAVAVLTTIDGGHAWPGWGGNRSPCASQNCDVDLLHEILQFWRAHGKMTLPLPN